MNKILAAFFLIILISWSTAKSQINYTVFFETTMTEGDDIVINDNNRQDNPFNSLRAKIFVNSWITDRVGVFLKFLYDDEASASYGDKLRVDGGYFLFDLHKNIGLMVGKIPIAMGSFPERSYKETNSLIGTPLMYQYRTSITANAVPDVYGLLERRGQRAGINIIYDACWDDGLQFFSEYGKIEYKLALTRASYSSPPAKTNNGYQIAGWLGVKPRTGLRIGAGYSLSPYLAKGATGIDAGKKLEDYKTILYSLDLQYAAGYLEFFSEYIHQKFTSGDGYYGSNDNDISLNGYYLEARYKLSPRIYLSSRYGSLLFSKVYDYYSGTKVPWDYDISRLESGFGYKVSRKMVIKAVTQINSYKNSPLDKVIIYALQLKAEM